jgi:hypothetical protein
MNTEIPTPRTNKAEYTVRLGVHKRKVVRPELCRELERELNAVTEQRDTLAEALELLLSISCAILKNDKKTLLSIATITDKKSGEQTSVIVIDALEAADAALATVQGGEG